jgi:hypothetical protein
MTAAAAASVHLVVVIWVCGGGAGSFVAANAVVTGCSSSLNGCGGGVTGTDALWYKGRRRRRLSRQACFALQGSVSKTF